MTVIPGWNMILVFSGKDLKPWSSSFLIFMICRVELFYLSRYIYLSLNLHWVNILFISDIIAKSQWKNAGKRKWWDIVKREGDG
jgi:hypothetical protein